ncbi:OpgD/OpgG family glucan biosynthesis protein [Alsobacter sp. R-9]
MKLTRRSAVAGSLLALMPRAGLADINNLFAARWFGHAVVEDRASRLALRPHEPPGRRVPPSINALDWDAWREIRFRSGASLFHDDGGRFRLQAFHLGHLFKRPVRLNIVDRDMASPIPYSATDFDYGQHVFDPPLPPDLGYAGWRVNYPLNKPGVFDELISFLGASYFRLLGRGQVYGLSARGLSIGSGRLDNNEEFPFFREFWFRIPERAADPAQDRLDFYALLDSPSLTGAYTFTLRPGAVTRLDVRVALFARQKVEDVGIAPLTSMFFIGENDRHYNDRNRYDDYRPEMHDSDGLQMRLDDGRWVWRPLRNPQIQEVSPFHTTNIRGFGLMQRDRSFTSYQDIDLAYQSRPSYWIEPRGDWGKGRLELIELATRDETADNIVAAWLPDEPLEPGRPRVFEYTISAGLDFAAMVPLGQVAHTFNAPVGALGAWREQKHHGSRRFLIDFSGGTLSSLLPTPDAVSLQAVVRGGKTIRSFVIPNPQSGGFRAVLDVKGIPNDTIYMEVDLRSGGKPLTETWSYRWKVE